MKQKHFLCNQPFVMDFQLSHHSHLDSPHKGLVVWRFDVFFGVSIIKLLNKQLTWWWFETPWYSWDYCSSIITFVCLPVHMFVCLSMSVYVYLSIHPSISPSIFPSIRPYVCLSVCLSVRLSVRLSVCLSVCLSVRLSAVCLSVSLSVSIHPFVCTCHVFMPTPLGTGGIMLWKQSGMLTTPELNRFWSWSVDFPNLG